AKKHRAFTGLLHVREACLPQHRKHLVFVVVLQMVTRVDEPSQESVLLRSSKIQQKQQAAWFQDAADFGERRRLLLQWQVMKHEGREDSVERRRGVGHSIRKTLVEMDRDLRSQRLLVGSGEGLRV